MRGIIGEVFYLIIMGSITGVGFNELGSKTVSYFAFTPEVAEPTTSEEPAAEGGAPALQKEPKSRYWVWFIAVGLVIAGGMVAPILKRYQKGRLTKERRDER